VFVDDVDGSIAGAFDGPVALGVFVAGASGNVLGLGAVRGGGVDPIGMRGPAGAL
jgi:hypothetical protein